MFEDDIITDDFRARVDRAVDIQKSLLGEGYSFGVYFYFSLFGPLRQAIDILCIVSAYNLIPLIRYPVALHNAYLLFGIYHLCKKFVQKRRYKAGIKTPLNASKTIDFSASAL